MPNNEENNISSTPPNSPPSDSFTSPNKSFANGANRNPMLRIGAIVSIVAVAAFLLVAATFPFRDELFSLIFDRDAGYAWNTSRQVYTSCNDGTARVNVVFTNAEDNDPKNTMLVEVTDLQTNTTIDLGSVAPGNTKIALFETGLESLAAGEVRIDLRWADGRSGVDRKTVPYDAIQCGDALADPYEYPVAVCPAGYTELLSIEGALINENYKNVPAGHTTEDEYTYSVPAGTLETRLVIYQKEGHPEDGCTTGADSGNSKCDGNQEHEIAIMSNEGQEFGRFVDHSPVDDRWFGPYDLSFVPKQGQNKFLIENADIGTGPESVDYVGVICASQARTTSSTPVPPTNTPIPTNTPVPQNSSIGDTVFEDENEDGIQDSNENGIGNVPVTLYSSCSADTVADTTSTDDNGQYLFDGLAAGEYRVMFGLPTGYEYSPKDEGSDDSIDSDADVVTGVTDCITVNGNDDQLIWDAGMYTSTGTPLPSPTPGVGLIGDTVFIDTNKDGIQDLGEGGKSGVTVELLACTDDSALESTVTAIGGKYEFDNLSAGSYRVRFLRPADYVFSPMDQGSDDLVDSDPNVNTGTTECITLAAGESNTTVDAGVYEEPNATLTPAPSASPTPVPSATPAPSGTPVPTSNPTPTSAPEKGSIGDFVFNDTDGDGVQDSGETGKSGVTVNLLSACTGTNVLEATTTDSTGEYVFSNINAGSYRVKFVLPTGYWFSPQNQGTNDAIDSDANTSTGISDCITLAAGQNLTTVDAGVYMPAPTPTPGGAGAPAPTATPTPGKAIAPSPTPIATQLPDTGTVANTLALSFLSLLFMAGGYMLFRRA